MVNTLELNEPRFLVQGIGIVFLLVFASATGCSKSGSNSGKVQAQSGALKKEIENFKKDSLGCQGLRTDKSIKLIFDQGKIEGNSKTQLVKLIGMPNDSVVANGLVSYKYYFGRTCFKGVPVDSVESCWAIFHIEIVTRIVSGVRYVCQ